MTTGQFRKKEPGEALSGVTGSLMRRPKRTIREVDLEKIRKETPRFATTEGSTYRERREKKVEEYNKDKPYIRQKRTLRQGINEIKSFIDNRRELKKEEEARRRLA